MKIPNCNSRGCPFGAASVYFRASFLVGLALLVGPALAGDAPGAKKQTRQEAAVKAEKKIAEKKSDEKVVITGSLIPEKTKPSRIPLTCSPVIIIGRTDIERSGEATLAGVLRKIPR